MTRSLAEPLHFRRIGTLSSTHKIADLHHMQAVLSELVEACEANEDPQTCPIVESLATIFVEDI